MMNILVTGSTGFIGNHLLGPLARHHQLFAVCRTIPTGSGKKITWLKADLANSNLALQLPQGLDAILYLAQSKHYREFPAKTWDIFNVNVRSPLWFLEYAREHGVKRFIYTSSANVYQYSQDPIPENGVLDPTSFYARSKQMAEMFVQSYSQFFECTVLRLFTIYGPGQRNTLFPSLIEKVRLQQPIQIVGKEGLKLSPLYITDLVKILESVLAKEPARPGFNLFNVGGDEHVSIYQLGKAIGDVLGIEPNFEFLPGEEVGGWMADNSKLKANFKLGAFLSLAEGLSELAKHKNG